MKRLSATITAICILAILASCGTPVTPETILQAWKSAGLQAESYRPMTKDEYGAAPYVCSGTRFFIPALGEEQGGRLFQCENSSDRDALAEYYTKLGKQSALFFSWVFVKGDYIVQINGNLDEATARQYESVLNNTVP